MMVQKKAKVYSGINIALYVVVILKKQKHWTVKKKKKGTRKLNW